MKLLFSAICYAGSVDADRVHGPPSRRQFPILFADRFAASTH